MTYWQKKYENITKFGDNVASRAAMFIGSWTFLILQTTIFTIWVLFNTLVWFKFIHFDPYPFILFNLFMSAEAAYSGPLILMNQNRQDTRDRMYSRSDFRTNAKSKEEIEELQRNISRIENEKLESLTMKVDQLLKLLDK